MPKKGKKKDTKKLDLSLLTLLHMIFAQINVNTKKGKPVCLSNNESKLYSFFHELKKEFGQHFEALEKMHFNEAGAFPYSYELTEALHHAKELGISATLGDELLILEPGGSEKFLKGYLAIYSEGDAEFPKRFKALVTRFDKIRMKN